MWRLTLATALASTASAFYLPGVAPTDYDVDERVPLLVNSLTPSYYYQDSLNSLISYDYYTPHLHNCMPPGGPEKVSESLGSILFGDRIFTSPFELYMAKNESCKTLCSSSYNREDARWVLQRLVEDYNHNWLIDGLLAASELVEYYEDEDDDDDDDEDKQDKAKNDIYYIPGFPLTSYSDDYDDIYFNNHYDIKVEYHVTAAGKYRVVGVSVSPKSINYDGQTADCDARRGGVHMDRDTDSTEVTFSYSVTWVPSSTAWATRWDKYLYVHDTRVHWFSLVNSVVIVVFLSAMVSTVLFRALHKDIERYNEIDLSEDMQEDSGWKLVHGDVFRSPPHIMWLSCFLGSGAQLFAMVAITLVFAILGFLSPSNRGALTTVMLLLFTLFGIVGGFVSARAYRTFGGEAWKLNMVLTPVVVPGIIFGAFVALNFFLIFANGSGAIPIGTMVAVVAIWFAISVPLSVVGSLLALKRPPYSLPVRTNQIPRQIPAQPSYLKPVPSFLLAGILPFGAIFVELYFILNSIWFHKLYYMFGFLFIGYGLMVVTCASVTVLMTYFLLTAENYHWQWRSFILSGSCSFYLFAHALFYWFSKMSLGNFNSNVLYLGYSLLMAFVTFILTGTVGFITAFFFVRKIYSSIKID